MNRSLQYLFAAIVPTLALWLAAPPERSAVGLAVKPFAWPTLLIAHCLAAIPFAAGVVGFLIRRAEFRIPVWIAPLLGIVIAFGGYFVVTPLGEFLDDLGASFLVRCSARS